MDILKYRALWPAQIFFAILFIKIKSHFILFFSVFFLFVCIEQIVNIEIGTYIIHGLSSCFTKLLL